MQEKPREYLKPNFTQACGNIYSPGFIVQPNRHPKESAGSTSGGTGAVVQVPDKGRFPIQNQTSRLIYTLINLAAAPVYSVLRLPQKGIEKEKVLHERIRQVDIL
ncbi:hypothetical protein [Microcoleus sp. FACHB-68]|uniref:hypothetical protein n=1 Tax=Microcoleus sp. FACHB-68 TaxID=2692826 RepID=UPI00168994F0|nr:hypothetical protein [Microcoleus sp. FACHB-68]MBD1940599.1 hypothetical protein [Microcoleus sp. FACHB-68]